ncbi:MAG: hypothetical protein QUS35_09905 [bacterium]|nr:hypothetical protein [bacterium]
MKWRFIMSGFATSAINLCLNAFAYKVLLKDFYHSHSAISEECMRQLHRQPNELIVWAMVITSLSMGFLITMIMKWSGANDFMSGLKKGLLTALLFWGSVNFGLYASSNFFSQSTVFVDYACSVSAMTVSAAFSAWMLGGRRDVSKS